jgi:hypothetical protein
MVHVVQRAGRGATARQRHVVTADAFAHDENSVLKVKVEITK